MAEADSKDDVKDVKPRVSPAQFVREVRIEAAKVTWPTRKEWGVTTIMVFIMVVLATIFFFLVDSLLSFGVRTLITGV